MLVTQSQLFENSGRTRTGRSEELTVFATSLELLNISAEPPRLLTLLAAVQKGLVPLEEAAAQLPPGESLLPLLQQLLQDQLTAKEHADELARAGPNVEAELPRMPVEARIEKFQEVAAKRQRGLYVVLEDIGNPSNAAAILRTCDAFGVTEVLFVFERGEGFDIADASLHKSSSSSYLWVRTQVFSSTAECFTYLKGVGATSFATSLHSESTSIYQTNLTSEVVAIWMGNEARGLSAQALDAADQHVHIPMVGMVESLNISVSAAVVVAEVMRQRKCTERNFSQDAAQQSKTVESFVQSQQKHNRTDAIPSMPAQNMN